MAGGRPTDYDSSFCQKVIDLGKEGASKAEMAFALGCARSTFALWEEAHQEFSEAVKTAVGFSQGWWESQGRKAVFGATPNFNATAFIFNMKNRFPADWRDKVEQEHTGNVTFQTVYEAPPVKK
jgi:hypothetical protein